MLIRVASEIGHCKTLSIVLLIGEVIIRQTFCNRYRTNIASIHGPLLHTGTTRPAVRIMSDARTLDICQIRFRSLRARNFVLLRRHLNEIRSAQPAFRDPSGRITTCHRILFHPIYVLKLVEGDASQRMPWAFAIGHSYADHRPYKEEEEFFIRW